MRENPISLVNRTALKKKLSFPGVLADVSRSGVQLMEYVVLLDLLVRHREDPIHIAREDIVSTQVRVRMRREFAAEEPDHGHHVLLVSHYILRSFMRRS